MHVNRRAGQGLRRIRMGALCSAFVCLLAALAGCGSRGEKPPAPRPPQVKVAKPVEQEVTDYLEIPGNLQAHGEVDLVARVEGFLQSIHFEDGDMVEEGQLLFVIEPQPFEADLRVAEATTAQQEATLLQAKQEYDRQLRMIDQRATSESLVQQWRATYREARAALKLARAKADLARINLGYTRVTAPFDGRMQRHLVDTGNLVGAGAATPLATIQRLDPIYAYFNVSAHDLSRLLAVVREGKTPPFKEGRLPVYLGVDGEEGAPHEGRLDYLSGAVDQTSGTLELRGIFSNPMKNRVPGLLPGMYARVRVPVEVNPHALLVPEEALGSTQGRYTLLLVNEKDVVEQRFVTVGRKVEDLRVIRKGLEATDRVIVSGIQYARPGSRVTPVPAQGSQKPASGTPPRQGE